MVTITRTEKEFSKENLPLDFLRRALAIAGLHTAPLKFESKDFEIEECWQGFKSPGGTCTPWSDDLLRKGYEKRRYALRIQHNQGFDTFATIFEQDATIQGYFKECITRQYACNQLKWVNLLLEYEFVKITE